MAPFTHFSRDRPTRFSNGNYGIYYAGDRFEVALKETVHHHERFMRATEEPESYEDFREYVGAVDHRFHDLRGKVNFADCLDPDDYSASQNLGSGLRNEGSDGIVYPSVRYPEGNALAAFWHLQYHWNGERVDRYFVYGPDEWRKVP